ncbi:hypothetical protein J8I87_42270 [Paraburkholderia sp. LEh10]|nr:hypothetical protein [Paraburkholderia sp. LEh10]MBP0596120.1 hypothetical protein [Paraburkholderia sp. LEh10]
MIGQSGLPGRKMKLNGFIVAISAISLLPAFMRLTESDLAGRRFEMRA